MTPKEKELYDYLSKRDYEDYYDLLEYWELEVMHYTPRQAQTPNK